MATQNFPLVAGGTLKVFGYSITGFFATSIGVISVVAKGGAFTTSYPVTRLGYHSLATPISSDGPEAGNATITSVGAAGTLTVTGPPAPVISPSPSGMLTTQLPAAALSPPGARSMVTDASVAYTGANVGTTVVGGGANWVPVFNNGTNWVIG